MIDPESGYSGSCLQGILQSPYIPTPPAWEGQSFRNKIKLYIATAESGISSESQVSVTQTTSTLLFATHSNSSTLFNRDCTFETRRVGVELDMDG